MMEKIVKFLFFICVVFNIPTNIYPKEKQRPEYIKYVYEIEKNFIKEMKKEYGLQCIGTGGGMHHDVEEIAVKFIAYQKATIDQSRKLEIKATEKLVKMINDHKKIRPFLREYPFPAIRVEISITYEKKKNEYYTDGSIAYVSHIKNKIYYYSAQPKTENLLKLHEEPYEKALEIVKGKSKKK